MKTVTKKYKVYSFDELSDEAQEKALLDNYDINVDYYWYYDEGIEDIAKEYGIKVLWKEANFDLERESYIAFETYNHGQEANYEKGIRIVDSKLFLKKAGFDLRKVHNLIDNFTINHKHYAGGVIANYIDCYYSTGLEDEKMQSCLDEMLEKMLELLKDSYNARTSNEAIKETIEANEYTFLEDGTMFNE